MNNAATYKKLHNSDVPVWRVALNCCTVVDAGNHLQINPVPFEMSYP